MGTCPCVVDAVTGPNINPQLPDSFAAEFVIAEVSQLDPVDTTVDGNPGLRVADLSCHSR